MTSPKYGITSDVRVKRNVDRFQVPHRSVTAEQYREQVAVNAAAELFRVGDIVSGIATGLPQRDVNSG